LNSGKEMLGERKAPIVPELALVLVLSWLSPATETGYEYSPFAGIVALRKEKTV
jgi:hypothetical protein